VKPVPPWRLIRRRNCPPCERLEQYLRGYFGESADAWLDVLDVDSAPHLVDQYGLRVPVLLKDNQVIVEGCWNRETLDPALPPPPLRPRGRS
jgi:hypothetical protein